MRLSGRCYAVMGLAYAPPWMVNAGFIVGDRETLIVDTGANSLAAATIHGYASAVREANALRVVNTEKHFDHIGGNGFFHELEVPIHGHAAIARTAEEYAEERSGFHPAFHYATALFNADHPITGPMEFDLGGCRAQVLMTPGHTETNLSIFVPEDRVLFCGDCLTSQYRPNMEASGGLRGWRTWQQSLDLLEALAPEVILCGHGPVVFGHDIAQVFREVRHALGHRVADALAATATADIE